MKRIIKASRLEDIERQEQEYEAKLAPYRQKADEQQSAYRNAAKNVRDRIETNILNAIGDTTLDLEVRAEQRWNEGEYEVRISANDRNHSDPKRALSWHWEAKLEDGEVKYDSGSWSGLKATTPEQLDDLQESLRILRKLQTIDWASTLKIDPEEIKYDKFVDRENARTLHDLERSKPDFKQMKKEAQLADLVGTNKVILVDGLSDSNYRSGYFRGYLQLVSENPGSYNVRMFSKYDVETVADPNRESYDTYKQYVTRQLESGATYRKLKKNVLQSIVSPIDIVDLDFLL